MAVSSLKALDQAAERRWPALFDRSNSGWVLYASTAILLAALVLLVVSHVPAAGIALVGAAYGLNLSLLLAQRSNRNR